MHNIYYNEMLLRVLHTNTRWKHIYLILNYNKWINYHLSTSAIVQFSNSKTYYWTTKKTGDFPTKRGEIKCGGISLEDPQGWLLDRRRYSTA